MKTTKYLWIVPIAGLLNLVGCGTAPQSYSPPPAVSTSGEAQTSYYVHLAKNAPTVVGVGEQFTYELTATAQSEASDVTVMDELPPGVSYISSQPEAAREGNKLTWKFEDMKRGQSKTIQVTVKADTEGQLTHCATASAIPQVCLSTLIGRPHLALTKTGPASAQLGQQVSYDIAVQNSGNAIARGVVVTDTLPEELTSSAGQKDLTFPVGDLAPGASKTITVPVKASKRGKTSNGAVAIASNAEKVSAECLTAIVQPELKIQLATQDKEIYINRTATYDIEVANTGDTSLTGVVLTDSAAPETPIAAAQGATVSGSTATWNVGTLQVGEKKNFTIKVVSKIPGQFTSSASVASAEGPRDSAKDSTTWIGVTGLTVEMVDETDPIQVGETSKFTIRVTNQGGSIDLSQLNIASTLPAELEFVANTCSDEGLSEGRTITWPASTVPPKSAVVRSFVVKGVKAGHALTTVAITSSASKDAIEQHESTTVY